MYTQAIALKSEKKSRVHVHMITVAERACEGKGYTMVDYLAGGNAMRDVSTQERARFDPVTTAVSTSWEFRTADQSMTSSAALS